MKNSNYNMIKYINEDRKELGSKNLPLYDSGYVRKIEKYLSNIGVGDIDLGTTLILQSKIFSPYRARLLNYTNNIEEIKLILRPVINYSIRTKNGNYRLRDLIDKGEELLSNDYIKLRLLSENSFTSTEGDEIYERLKENLKPYNLAELKKGGKIYETF